MDKLKLSNSLLNNGEILLKFFKLKYNYLPNSIDDLDPNILDSLQSIDDAYVNNLISFDETVGLMSKLFSGLEFNKNVLDSKIPLDSDDFYNLLLENKLDHNNLKKLFEEEKICYQFYVDGLNYLSRKNDEEVSFSR